MYEFRERRVKNGEKKRSEIRAYAKHLTVEIQIWFVQKRPCVTFFTKAMAGNRFRDQTIFFFFFIFTKKQSYLNATDLTNWRT